MLMINWVRVEGLIWISAVFGFDPGKECRGKSHDGNEGETTCNDVRMANRPLYSESSNSSVPPVKTEINFDKTSTEKDPTNSNVRESGFCRWYSVTAGEILQITNK
jgi:hypothetical protein